MRFFDKYVDLRFFIIRCWCFVVFDFRFICRWLCIGFISIFIVFDWMEFLFKVWLFWIVIVFSDFLIGLGLIFIFEFIIELIFKYFCCGIIFVVYFRGFNVFGVKLICIWFCGCKINLLFDFGFSWWNCVFFFFLLNEVYLLLYIFVEFILLFELLLCLLFKEFCREKFFENSLLLVYNLKLLLFMLIRFIVLFNVKGVLKLMLELLRKL